MIYYMDSMQKLLGLMRKAIQEFQMIQEGDRIAVGVSGGKDSIALLQGLQLLRRFLGVNYEIVGITLDLGFHGNPTDYSPVEALCREQEIAYYIKRTQIGEIVFDTLKEDNPCALCARMRRGALHDEAKAHGCNKIALGHHYDDAVETLVMNLFQGGRFSCFAPVTYLSIKDLTMIRPLVFAEERDVAAAVRKSALPIVKNPCPVDGATEREWTKQFLRQLEESHPGVTYKLFGSMRRAGIDGWGYTGLGGRHRVG